MPLDLVLSLLDLFLGECVVHGQLVIQGALVKVMVVSGAYAPLDPSGVDRCQSSSDSFEDVMRGFCVDCMWGSAAHADGVSGGGSSVVQRDKKPDASLLLCFSSNYPLPEIISKNSRPSQSSSSRQKTISPLFPQLSAMGPCECKGCECSGNCASCGCSTCGVRL